MKFAPMAAGAATAAAALLVLSAPAVQAAPALATNNVNLRQGPGTNFPVITTIPGGSTVDVSGCQGQWCAVTWQGRSGYTIATSLDQGGGPSGPGGGQPGAEGAPPPGRTVCRRRAPKRRRKAARRRVRPPKGRLPEVCRRAIRRHRPAMHSPLVITRRPAITRRATRIITDRATAIITAMARIGAGFGDGLDCGSFARQAAARRF
jgi:Bacterial SH3 domain